MDNFYDKMKSFIGLSAAGAAVLPLMTACNASEEKPKEPMNILLIMCVDLS